MITLQELFDDLAAGELSNVAMGNSEAGTVKEAQYPRLVSAVNIGLNEIYQRLNLRQGELKLHQYSGVTKYKLRSEHAEDVGYMDDEFYIEQTDDEPYEDDLIKVLSAVDSAGDKVRVNDSRYPADLFTSEFDVIKIAGPSTTITNYDGVTRTSVDTFTIKYQAKYPKIVLKQNFDPSKIKLQIPDFIEEPLLIYITHRLFKKPVKVVKGEVNPSSSLLIDFENAIRKIKFLDLAITVEDESDNFERNGWV